MLHKTYPEKKKTLTVCADAKVRSLLFSQKFQHYFDYRYRPIPQTVGDNKLVIFRYLDYLQLPQPHTK